MTLDRKAAKKRCEKMEKWPGKPPYVDEHNGVFSVWQGDWGNRFEHGEFGVGDSGRERAEFYLHGLTDLRAALAELDAKDQRIAELEKAIERFFRVVDEVRKRQAVDGYGQQSDSGRIEGACVLLRAALGGEGRSLPMAEKMTKAERLDEIVAWADSRRRHIEADSRFQDKPAQVFSNAFLALIQVELKTEHRALCAVLAMAKEDSNA